MGFIIGPASHIKLNQVSNIIPGNSIKEQMNEKLFWSGHPALLEHRLYNRCLF